MNAGPLLTVQALTKSYPGVHALKGVDISISPGEVHSVVGENGAGKSTLIKILAGAERRDGGNIEWCGEPTSIQSPHQAEQLGISVIHQDLNLAPNLSAAENMFLGRTQKRRLGVFVRWRAMNARAQAVANLVGADFDVRTHVHELSHAQKVLTAVGRALTTNARLIIMDEPTAALGAAEIDRLHEVIRSLSQGGTAIVYVSHRLEEVISISDSITVLKDGSLIGTFARAEITDTGHLTELIIGRSVTSRGRTGAGGLAGDVIVEVRGIALGNRLKDVSLEFRRGEILGLAGLVGSGRSELASVIFGAVRPDRGEVLVRGKPFKHPSPARAARRGLALLPEDRRHQASVPTMSVRENTTLASMSKYRWGPFIARRRERRSVADLIRRFQIKVANMNHPIRNLSGGNQQKVVVSRWVDRAPEVLLFDEPTQGIDVGAKSEIFDIMRRLAASGCAVLFISSEIEEVVEVADRIVVLREGTVRAEFGSGEATTETVLRACYEEGEADRRGRRGTAVPAHPEP
jgi:ABC-type sugar transport system ATPase subunit